MGEAEAGVAHSVRHRRLTGGTFAQAMRSFIDPVIGPHAAVCASRTASASEAPDAVPWPERPWNSTATEHSARWADRVDHSRNATKPMTTRRVMVRARLVMPGGTSGRGEVFTRSKPWTGSALARRG